MEGFRVAFASEFVPAARETYAANFPEVPIDDRDVRLLTAEDVRRVSGIGDAEVDVLEGRYPAGRERTGPGLRNDAGKVAFQDGLGLKRAIAETIDNPLRVYRAEARRLGV